MKLFSDTVTEMKLFSDTVTKMKHFSDTNEDEAPLATRTKMKPL
jgi:hypothetical protein